VNLSTDHPLLLVVRSGNVAQLDVLFQRHHRLLFNFFMKQTGNRQASEDLVQEVFLRMLKFGQTYQDEGDFKIWMFQIAHHAGIDSDRKQRHQLEPIEDNQSVPGNDLNPEQLLEQSDHMVTLALLNQTSSSKRLKGIAWNYQVDEPAGHEMIIEAQSRTHEIVTDEKKRKVDGMKRIPINTTGLSVEEDENRMDISVESWRRTIDLKLRVPFNTSMMVNCVNVGDIFIQNVNGEFDINNVNGKVPLPDISGSVMAHALNKDLVVTFKKFDPEKAMSFSILNGDVDVTFPANLKANVKLKSDNGEIYSDFEIKLDATPREVVEENNRGKSGKYRVKIDHTVQGKINGGGPEFQFTTFNGDVIIRMKK